jgi:hypothetical protein
MAVSLRGLLAIGSESAWSELHPALPNNTPARVPSHRRRQVSLCAASHMEASCKVLKSAHEQRSALPGSHKAESSDENPTAGTTSEHEVERNRVPTATKWGGRCCSTRPIAVAAKIPILMVSVEYATSAAPCQAEDIAIWLQCQLPH